MGATEEQMRYLSDADVTHVSYILILYSIAFLLYLCVNILLYIYANHTWPDDESNGMRNHSHSRNRSLALPTAAGAGSGVPGGSHARKSSRINGSIANGHIALPSDHANGSVRLPRHRATDSQQVRDAEEFELEGLISDAEAEDASPVERQKQEA